MQKKFLPLLARLSLMFGGLACALISMLVMVNLFPQLLPTSLRDPLDQRTRNETRHIVFTEDQGDIFIIMAGSVRPIENPQVLAEYDIAWDAEGFRVPAMQADHYPIIAIGDSFTEGYNVAAPWTDALAANLNTPVQNLGYRGYGPIEYQVVMDEYGRGEHEWVLLAFFEGNDLRNIQTSVQDPNTLERLTMLARDEEEIPQPFEIVERETDDYPYPMPVIIGSDYHELSFFDPFIWFLNAEPEEYATSQNVSRFRDILIDMQAKKHPDACFGVIYIPTKERMYFPYSEINARRWILEIGYKTVAHEDGWLGGADEQVDFETMVSRFSNERDVIQTMVGAIDGLHFIDLSPAFEQAAAEGQILYYAYDTHWNQAGHDMAGSLIAEYIRQHPDC